MPALSAFHFRALPQIERHRRRRLFLRYTFSPQNFAFRYFDASAPARPRDAEQHIEEAGDTDITILRQMPQGRHCMRSCRLPKHFFDDMRPSRCRRIRAI